MGFAQRYVALAGLVVTSNFGMGCAVDGSEEPESIEMDQAGIDEVQEALAAAKAAVPVTPVVTPPKGENPTLPTIDPTYGRCTAASGTRAAAASIALMLLRIDGDALNPNRYKVSGTSIIVSGSAAMQEVLDTSLAQGAGYTESERANKAGVFQYIANNLATVTTKGHYLYLTPSGQASLSNINGRSFMESVCGTRSKWEIFRGDIPSGLTTPPLPAGTPESPSYTNVLATPNGGFHWRVYNRGPATTYNAPLSTSAIAGTTPFSTQTDLNPYLVVSPMIQAGQNGLGKVSLQLDPTPYTDPVVPTSQTTGTASTNTYSYVTAENYSSYLQRCTWATKNGLKGRFVSKSSASNLWMWVAESNSTFTTKTTACVNGTWINPAAPTGWQ